jgi:sulfur-carrier protein adenylyltransferase/sulfurtransferase
MSKKYIIPVALLLGLALLLVLLPEKKVHDEMAPEELLRHINSTSRFISSDMVADRLIKKDPSMLLVDVRSADLHKDFTLPGALSIPLAGIIQPENIEMLTQEGLDVIFFSTDDILANQAWIICKRKGIKNIYVMKGGLNEWFTSFFKLQPPPETAPSEEIALYQFRLGVQQYFTGADAGTVKKAEPETISITPKKKKSAAEGGC